ncbi:hypothetical protein CDAR_65791 [Caerostris darwini]|uniref:Uncharacterized protein n=1 Tax=Caerostris darwini TaxID=1538125 RepID=A0AAV4UC51_9ARAC|nr:hypothetical protein CDAR_65791 [Caerostris darwini]
MSNAITTTRYQASEALLQLSAACLNRFHRVLSVGGHLSGPPNWLGSDTREIIVYKKHIVHKCPHKQKCSRVESGDREGHLNLHPRLGISESAPQKRLNFTCKMGCPA